MNNLRCHPVYGSLTAREHHILEEAAEDQRELKSSASQKRIGRGTSLKLESLSEIKRREFKNKVEEYRSLINQKKENAKAAVPSRKASFTEWFGRQNTKSKQYLERQMIRHEVGEEELPPEKLFDFHRLLADDLDAEADTKRPIDASGTH